MVQNYTHSRPLRRNPLEAVARTAVAALTRLGLRLRVALCVADHDLSVASSDDAHHLSVARPDPTRRVALSPHNHARAVADGPARRAELEPICCRFVVDLSKCCGYVVDLLMSVTFSTFTIHMLWIFCRHNTSTNPKQIEVMEFGFLVNLSCF